MSCDKSAEKLYLKKFIENVCKLLLRPDQVTYFFNQNKLLTETNIFNLPNFSQTNKKVTNSIITRKNLKNKGP